ncbi:MAG TPA: phosphotransferase family protein [Micropepsaceae bacterium]|nr:phosphotransferase family protein [Micropepsaceae bacterium]
MTSPDLADLLRDALSVQWPGVTGIANLARLSGGASQETWAFDAIINGANVPLILRRVPGGKRASESATAAPLATEAAVIGAAQRAGVPVPQVHAVFAPDSAVGEAYVMARLSGETLARKILRDEAFAGVRPKLARQCGQILARIHATDAHQIAGLRISDGPTQLQQYRTIYESYDKPRPVFELGFAWLKDQLPPCPAPRLVHGDFRNGNLMIGPDGVRGVLDWELVHLGDPREDLGWLCVNSWRFGVSQKRVGGFGDVADLLAGYEEVSGVRHAPREVMLFEALGSLKWGIMCMTMYEVFASGADSSVERAAIGRRASEAEMDLINLMKEARA